MRDELTEAFALLRVSDDCVVVVLHGEGRAFCAGADLTEFDARTPLAKAREVRHLRDPFRLLRELPQVTITALHGYAIGSGMELALECDLRLAAASTRFRLPETHLGFIPAAGATQTLTRTVGRGAALDLLLRGETVHAAQALQMGLVSQVVPDDEIMLFARSLGEEIAQRPAAIVAKRALRASGEHGFAAGLELEAALGDGLLVTPLLPGHVL